MKTSDSDGAKSKPETSTCNFEGFCPALGQTLAPICSWANASGHLLVGQLLATINACLPQCLWCKCLCQTACAQTACVNLLAASQKVNLLVVKLLAGQLLVFSWRLRCEFKE